MSNYCKQCSIDIFGEDFNELSGLLPKQLIERGMVANVICEGCGSIQVDNHGNCLTKNCLRQGRAGHGIERTDIEEVQK